jgi:hypothetical protein
MGQKEYSRHQKYLGKIKGNRDPGSNPTLNLLYYATLNMARVDKSARGKQAVSVNKRGEFTDYSKVAPLL